MRESEMKELADLMRVLLDKERLEFERTKFESERVGIAKRLGLLIPFVVSIAAIVVSVAQIRIAVISRDKQIELQQFEGEAARVLQRQMQEAQLKHAEAEAKREWDLKFATFMAENSDDVFSSDSIRRKQMRLVIELTYPRQAWDALFRRIAEASPTSEVRESWRSAQRESRRGWLPPPIAQVNPTFDPSGGPSGTIVPSRPESVDPLIRPPSVESRDPAIGEMARLVNARRQARGCPALVWLQPAAEAAQAHSADMARRGYFDHTSPEGRQPWDRLTERGVSYRTVAENIAWTPEQGARQTLAGWIASPGHRANLENCAYTHHGIGLQSAYWTHVFVTPAAARQ